MKKIIRLIDSISDFFGKVAGVAILLGTLLVLGEIVVRTFFSRSLYITSEYSGYLMVSIAFLGLAYTLKEKTHIRMVFLYKLFKGRNSVYLDIYACIIGLIIFGLITISTFNFFWDSVLAKTRSMHISKTYLAIPQFLMPLGSFIMTLQFFNEILKSILKLSIGDLDMENKEVESEFLGR